MFEKLHKDLKDSVNISDSLWNEFSKMIYHEQFSKGSFYIKQGHVAHKIGYMTQGSFKAKMLNEDQVYCTDFFNIGDFVSEFDSFISREPAKTSIVAHHDSEVLSVNHSDFLVFFSQNEEGIEVQRRIYAYIYQLMFEQEIILRTVDAKTRLNMEYKRAPQVFSHFYQSDIASYLKMSRETFNRIYNQQMTNS